MVLIQKRVCGCDEKRGYCPLQPPTLNVAGTKSSEKQQAKDCIGGEMRRLANEEVNARE
jgi:hypothetical protein